MFLGPPTWWVRPDRGRGQPCLRFSRRMGLQRPLVDLSTPTDPPRGHARVQGALGPRLPPQIASMQVPPDRPTLPMAHQNAPERAVQSHEGFLADLMPPGSWTHGCSQSSPISCAATPLSCSQHFPGGGYGASPGATKDERVQPDCDATWTVWPPTLAAADTLYDLLARALRTTGAQFQQSREITTCSWLTQPPPAADQRAHCQRARPASAASGRSRKQEAIVAGRLG